MSASNDRPHGVERSYDDTRRLETITHEATLQHTAKTEIFNFDLNGNLDDYTTRAGVLIDYEYDTLNRLRSKDVAGGTSGDASFTYDQGGRLETAVNDHIAFLFQYNHRDELTHETVTAMPGFDGALPSLVYEYDDAGNLTDLQYSDGSAVTYVPDALDRLEKIQRPAGTDLASHTYDSLSLVTGRTFASGARTLVGYDAAGGVDWITHEGPASATIQTLDYTLDATGAVKKIVEAGTDVIYGYDLTKQLTSADFPGTRGREDVTLTYDDAGNRATGTFGTDPLFNYDRNELNQYTTVAGQSQSHDANGSLLNNGTFSFEWDAEGQLIEIKDPTGTMTFESYAYDPFGRRIRKTVAGANRWFVWGGDRLMEEYADDETIETRYVYGSGYAPVVVDIESGSGLETYEVHTDHLDTPRLLTDSSTGAVVWQADYWAFGKAELAAANSVTFNLRFPGQYFEAETGLHYNYHRYYDPGIGRYLSPDPIGQLGGVNIYTYTFNNPVNGIDPLGLGPPGGGWQGAGNSFANPYNPSPEKRTDAEVSQQQKSLGRAVSTIAAGGGVGAALSKGPVPPQVKLGLAGLGLTGTLLTNDPSLDPDGDNDNDGIPDVVDPDDDNDLLPDELDHEPLIRCDFGGGACMSPVEPPKDSCQPGDPRD